MLLAHFTTSEGKFTIQLFDQEAPKTVENFVGLAEGTKEWTGPLPPGARVGPFLGPLRQPHEVLDRFGRILVEQLDRELAFARRKMR